MQKLNKYVIRRKENSGFKMKILEKDSSLKFWNM